MVNRYIAGAGDTGDMIYAMCAVKAMGGGHLRFWRRNYVRDPMTVEKVASIASFFASQPYIQSVGYDDTVIPSVNLDDFRSTWQRLRRGGTTNYAAGRPYSICEIIMMTFNLPINLAQQKWLDIKPDAYRFQPSVIFSRSFRYRNNKFPWKLVHEKYENVACFLGTPSEHSEFEGNVGRIPYMSTPTLIEAAQLISTCKLFVGNQNALMAIAIGARVPHIVQETWMAEPNCLFDCVTPGFDSSVKLPDL